MLTVQNRTIHVAENTYIYINTQALHCDPRTWGDDVLQWRPSRWLVRDTTTREEAFIQPPKGAFIPWADGPRGCPGKMFAQAEFVGIMATLFCEHSVRPLLLPDEDESTARQRLKNIINDSAITEITLQMKRSRMIGLVWEKNTS